MSPDWTLTNFAIQAISGFAGAHGAAAAAHEHRFGFLGHSIVGLMAGALSDYFLQQLAATTVFGADQVMPANAVESTLVQVLTGAVSGGIAMMVVGLISHETRKAK